MTPLDDLKISVSQANPQGEAMVLRLDGILDTLTAPKLDGVMTQLLQQKRYKVVCDLAGVDYISSAGWGIFVSHLKEIRDNQGDLKLVHLHPDVAEIFELLEFDSIIKCYDSLDQAASDFSRGGPVRPQERERASAVSVLSPSINPTSQRKSTPESLPGSIPAKAGLAEKILTLVREDPLLRISEIRSVLATPRFQADTSWWKVFRILRKNRLLKLRSRCLYSRLS